MCELGATHMSTETKTKYRRYDEAFKKSAVEHWLLSGKSARIIAGELGINEPNLHKWKQPFKALPAGQVAGTLEALQAENRRRQKELHRVAQPRGQRCGRTRIARLMRTAGLSSRLRRRFQPVSLTDSNHDLPVAPNRLRELPLPQQRDAVWVADITYVETGCMWRLLHAALRGHGVETTPPHGWPGASLGSWSAIC